MPLKPAQVTPAGASGGTAGTRAPLCPAGRPKPGPVNPSGACYDYRRSSCLSPRSASLVLLLLLRVSETSPSPKGSPPPVFEPCRGGTGASGSEGSRCRCHDRRFLLEKTRF